MGGDSGCEGKSEQDKDTTHGNLLVGEAVHDQSLATPTGSVSVCCGSPPHLWVADALLSADTARVPSPQSLPFVGGPLVAALALVLIVLICRWVFSTNRTPTRPTPEGPRDLGLLTAVATVRTRDDAEMLRDVLRAADLTVGISEDAGELQVLVFTKDLAQARALVCA